MADQEPVKRQRVSPWKILAVLTVLVALTPALVVYGYLGVLLTLPPSSIAKGGLMLLSALSLWVSFQVFTAVNDSAMRKKLALQGWFAVLLLAQWKVGRLLVFHWNRKPEDRRVDPAGLALLAVLVVVTATLTKTSLSLLSQSHILSSWALYAFAMIYLVMPVVVYISHTKLWVPARYSELERIEHDLIKRNVKVAFEMLKVAGLGTVHVPCSSVNAEKKLPLVLIHGYAAGNGLWACNFEELSTQYDVYAVEWLGTARSDRPKFTSYEVDYADAMFVDALENWRKELEIDKFYLGGHSMGAMFASSYAVKYPGHVQHLVLISPAGVGHPPVPGSLPLGLRVFRSIWNLKWTPMSVARYAGPLGPTLLRFMAKVRVSVMPETSCIRRGLIPVETLAAYWYNNWGLKKSGEIAMHSHLYPGVFAKKPLCEMLTPDTIDIPITFMYGGGPDWMSSSHGREVAKAFTGKQRVEVLMVPGAGHQVFMDNVPAFNQMLLEALAKS